MNKKIHFHPFSIEFNAPTTLGFASICLFVYVLDLFSQRAVTDVFFTVYKTNLLDPLQYMRLLTHVFGHADRQHLFNNMVMILLLGPMLEEKHGSKGIAFMMLVTALVTGLISVLFMKTGIRGASGIVFMFFFLASFSNMKVKGNIPFTFLTAVVVFIIEGLFFSTNVQNMSYMAHGVGALCGAIYGWLTEEPNQPTVHAEQLQTSQELN